MWKYNVYKRVSKHAVTEHYAKKRDENKNINSAI